MLPAQPNRSLIDGLTVLQAVSGATAAVGSRELARRLGMEPTRVNRLLKTLAGVGLLQQTPERRYRPGAGLHVLAATALFGSHLLASAVEPVERLRERVPRMTVALGVRWRTEVAYLLYVLPGMPLSHGVGRTALFPARRSSIGRVLLAEAGAEEVRGLYPGDEGLLRSLGRVRREGYALLTTEPQPSVAVPVRAGGGRGETAEVVAALAIAGRFRPEQVPTLLPHLRQAAIEMGAVHTSEEVT